MPRPKQSAEEQRVSQEWQNRKAAERMQAKRDAARDIGEIPRPRHKKQRARGETDSEFFLKFFFPKVFRLPFGDPHTEYIAALDRIFAEGGQQAVAMQRGGGKSSVTRGMALKAVLYGIRSFVMSVGANDDKSLEAMQFWTMSLLRNEKLIEAFPEVCYPLCKVGRVNQRKPLYKGKELEMGMGDMIILPDIPKSKAAGNVLFSASLMSSNLRGTQYMRSDGAVARPDVIILDDPQTPDSAKSANQTNDRESIVLGDCLGMAGPDVEIAAIMPCTPLRPNDLAERFLSHELRPEWRGLRVPMLYSLPTNMKLWEEYNRLRTQGVLGGHGLKLATAFYKENRAAMDEGAKASWPDQLKPGTLSAIQVAMNYYFTDLASFMAERQMNPLRQSNDVEQLSRDALLARLTEVEQGVVPEGTTLLTAFADVHKDVIYWVVCAWADGFTGQVIQYGTFPEQTELYFNLVDVRNTLGKLFPGMTMEMAVKRGVTETLTMLLGRRWSTISGQEHDVSLALVDSGWGQTKNHVMDACSLKAFRSRCFPSKGKGIGPGDRNIAEWRRQQHDIPSPLARCYEWILPHDTKGNPCRSVTFNTNHWKSFAAERLMSPVGAPGSLAFHALAPGHDHRLIVDHCCAEKRTPWTTKFANGDVWVHPPHRPDNHWWDGIVGCCVAASMRGMRLQDIIVDTPAEKPKRRRKRVHFSQLEF